LDEALICPKFFLLMTWDFLFEEVRIFFEKKAFLFAFMPWVDQRQLSLNFFLNRPWTLRRSFLMMLELMSPMVRLSWQHLGPSGKTRIYTRIEVLPKRLFQFK
jgi:hypothetical protein